MQSELLNRPGYQLQASPTLYPGQIVKSGLFADRSNQQPAVCAMFIMIYGKDDQLNKIQGPSFVINPGEVREITWQIEETQGAPIAEIGFEVTGLSPSHSVLYLDYLTWAGSPDTVFKPSAGKGVMWRHAWVSAMDRFVEQNSIPFWLVQNRGRGLISQGTQQWEDYQVETRVTPHLVRKFGIALRIQGLQRYYALLLCDDMHLRLVKVLDGEQVLSEVGFEWECEESYLMSLRVSGNRLEALLDGHIILEAEDSQNALHGGGAGLICEEGCVSTDYVKLSPTTPASG
jgi:hypothetical protein